jgi:16S rRNA processing protein RimM
MLAAPPTCDRSRGRSLPLKEEGRKASASSPSTVTDEGKTAGDAAQLCLGIITGAHGIAGQVRVKSFTAEPEAIAHYGVLRDEAGTPRFELDLVGASKGVLIARLKGVSDRNAAESLKGTRLYVRRGDLPEPEADEFYHADLIGLEARLADGAVLGKVAAVHDFGAGASIEIEDAAGKSVMVPFTLAAVPSIDIEGGWLKIVPPAGLFDAPKPEEQEQG